MKGVLHEGGRVNIYSLFNDMKNVYDIIRMISKEQYHGRQIILSNYFFFFIFLKSPVFSLITFDG